MWPDVLPAPLAWVGPPDLHVFYKWIFDYLDILNDFTEQVVVSRRETGIRKWTWCGKIWEVGPTYGLGLTSTEETKWTVFWLMGLLASIWVCILLGRNGKGVATVVCAQPTPGGPKGRRGFTRQPESPNVHI